MIAKKLITATKSTLLLAVFLFLIQELGRPEISL